jgi:uncharacterized membrane protein
MQHLQQAEKHRSWAMVASVILSVAGLAISVWWFVWYYAPVLPTPCGAGSPAGVAYNCPQVTIAVHWTVLGRPIATFGIAYFLAMSILSMPPVWKTPRRWVHLVRLGIALVGGGLSVYAISVEPVVAFTHYYGLPMSIVIALLLFVLTVATLPRAIAFPSTHRQIGDQKQIVGA